jgi:hypothetical protein
MEVEGADFADDESDDIAGALGASFERVRSE